MTWVVGCSFASDQNNGSNNVDSNQFKVYQFGVDTVMKCGGWSFQAEYMGRWLDIEKEGATRVSGGSDYAHGFYAQTGCFIVPQTVEIAGRCSAVWGDGCRYPGNGFTAGPVLSWFMSKSHKVKLQADVLYVDIDTDAPVNSSKLVTEDPYDPKDPDGERFSSSSTELRAGDQGVMTRVQMQLQFG